MKPEVLDLVEDLRIGRTFLTSGYPDRVFSTLSTLEEQIYYMENLCSSMKVLSLGSNIEFSSVIEILNKYGTQHYFRMLINRIVKKFKFEYIPVSDYSKHMQDQYNKEYSKFLAMLCQAMQKKFGSI